MGFKIALHNLAHEYDLFGAEEALNDSALELQLQVLSLANSNKTAKAITSEMLNEDPVVKLSAAILTQAIKDGVRSVRIELSDLEETPVRILFKTTNGWDEVMTVPSGLSRPLHGSFYRIERANFTLVREHIDFSQELPETVEFTQLTDALIELSI